MPHPRVRTWTLSTLDPTAVYRLWLDPEANRWEVAVIGDGDETPLTTRPAAAPRGARAHRAQARSAEREGAPTTA